jgi:hypothetical protein
MITPYLNLLFTSSASLALVGVLIAELRLLTIFLGTEFLDIFLFCFVLFCFVLFFCLVFHLLNTIRITDKYDINNGNILTFGIN